MVTYDFHWFSGSISILNKWGLSFQSDTSIPNNETFIFK